MWAPAGLALPAAGHHLNPVRIDYTATVGIRPPCPRRFLAKVPGRISVHRDMVRTLAFIATYVLVLIALVTTTRLGW